MDEVVEVLREYMETNNIAESSGKALPGRPAGDLAGPSGCACCIS